MMSETMLSPERLKERLAVIVQLLAWGEVTSSGARAQTINLLPWKARAALLPAMREEMLRRLQAAEGRTAEPEDTVDDITSMILDALEAQGRQPTRNLLQRLSTVTAD